MRGQPQDGRGRPALLVGVSVTGLPEERAAFVATLSQNMNPSARIWRHVPAAGPAGSPGGAALLPALVGVRLSDLRRESARATADPSGRPGALALPICFYLSADVALRRLCRFVETSLGVRVPDGVPDAELRDFGVTSDQALGDWLRAAAGAGFRTVALWPVAFATALVPDAEFDTAARHAVQLAVLATGVSG